MVGVGGGKGVPGDVKRDVRGGVGLDEKVVVAFDTGARVTDGIAGHIEGQRRAPTVGDSDIALPTTLDGTVEECRGSVKFGERNTPLVDRSCVVGPVAAVDRAVRQSKAGYGRSQYGEVVEVVQMHEVEGHVR